MSVPLTAKLDRVTPETGLPGALTMEAGAPEIGMIDAMQKGDRVAFEAFVRENHRWVRGVLLGVLGDPEVADDVMQSVWQTVWTRIDRLRDKNSWRTWLYRLARNAALDAGREKTRRKRLAGELVERAGHDGPAEPQVNTMRDEQREAVGFAIRSLPAIYREPFVLRHVEGWNYRKIAETMDMPVPTVETRLVRARQMLRDTLNGKV